MPEKVKQTGISPETGWSYFLDEDGDVSRSPDDENGEVEKVAVLGFKIADDDPLLYFIDTAGDLASQTVAEYEAEVAASWKQTEEAIRKDYEERGFASAFDPTKNRYWIVKGNRRLNDLREMLEPRRVHTWRTARLPRDIDVGDRVVFWESAPHLHVVGIGEVGAWDREKDIFGNAHFWLMYQSRFIDGGPTVDELRKDVLFNNASFLKAAVAGTLFALTPEQAESLAGRLRALDESIHQSWPDVFSTVADQPKPQPQTDEAPERSEHRKKRSAKSAESESRPTSSTVQGARSEDEQPETLYSAGIVKEEGWTYTVDNKGIYRVPDDNPEARRQWVHKASIKMEDGYAYYVNEDGDAARITYEGARAIIRRDRLAERKTPILTKPLHPAVFTPTPGETYRILSVHAPWAWSIIFAGKDIENRSWGTPYRGPILIHASSRKYVGKALDEARSFIAECSGMPIEQVPTEFPRSQILGVVDVLDCVQDHESPWAESFGTVNWVLSQPRRLASPVENVDGKLNLWSWTAA